MHGLDDLPERERELVEAAQRGLEFKCSDLSVDSLVSDAVDQRDEVRAELLRELLTGRYGPLDPHGVRVRGARIIGRLDLDHVKSEVGLSLIACVLMGEIHAEYATLRHVVLRGSHLNALHADGLCVEGDLVLEDVKIVSENENGSIRLLLAEIKGQMDCDSLVVSNTSGPALLADRIRVGSDLFLRSVSLASSSESGSLQVTGAKIGGDLALDKAKISNEAGPAVVGDSIKVGGSIHFNQTQVLGTGPEGAVRLLNAQIEGQAGFKGGAVINGSGPAIIADGINVRRDIIFHAFKSRGDHVDGAIRLPGAQISGQGEILNSEVANSSGAAILADNLQVGGNLIVQTVKAVGSGHFGTFRLVGAVISGRFVFSDVEIGNASGPAVHADTLRVNGSIQWQRFVAQGGSNSGMVRMSGARVGVQLDFQGEIVNNAGVALHADGLSVESRMMLAIRAHGVGKLGVIRLPGARIGGQFEFHRTYVSSTSADLIELQGATVGGAMFLPFKSLCPAEGTGKVCFHPGRIGIDDFKYATLGNGSWHQWLHLIRCHTGRYRPQPYQQLAAIERAAGHDKNARNVLVAQQRDRLIRSPESIGKFPFTFFHRIWGAIAGYGYRASYLATVLIAFLFMAGSIGYIAGQVDTRPGHHVAERVVPGNVADKTNPGVSCSTIELIGLGLDRGLPLGPAGMRNRCDLDTSTKRGQAFTIAMWIIQAFLWGLVTLGIAGYTSLIRRPS
ncbi:hypothetical protein SAMN05660733_07285 [Lentzea albidocapillata]|uniref:Membrane-associated oxidoreductase n=2 Tax=Lentzea albidocapillata TaxID=40571 RepID=A0A1W2FPA2_9PSEU|nr:hypothetical protein SAMN05660733_07285 [Lentzea albidocapillata]